VVLTARSKSMAREHMPTNFHEELLSQGGMAEVRSAAMIGFAWYTHARTTDQYATIQSEGIRPTWPQSNVTPQEVIDAIGTDGKNIICLSPYPKKTILMLNKGGNCVFKLAIQANKLPARLGIDWSFGGTWDLTNTNRRLRPDLSRADVFMSILRSREVIVSYDPVPAVDLRVCTEVLRNNPPSDWPPLVGTDLKDVAIFSPDLIGNIAL
jgi:hypothetical protein